MTNQPTVTIKENIVKFTNCPTEFEMPIDLLRNKMRKIPELKIPEGQARKFAEFYNDIVTEKSEKHVALMFEMFKFIRTRSVRFVPPVQDIDYNIGKPSYMKWCVRDYLFKNKGKPFSFFCSTYHVKHTEDGVAIETKAELKRPYAFDVVIDQDPPDAYENTKMIIAYLEKTSPFHVVFSGRGFHTWIMFDDLVECFNVKKQESYTSKEIVKIYKKIEDEIIKNTGITNIGHANKEFQLIRVPYSLNEKTNRICLPLDEKQFYDFKPEIADIENVLKLELRNRGMPLW